MVLVQHVSDVCQIEEIRVRWRVQSIARDICAKLFQPQTKPRTFEAGVAGDKDGTAFERLVGVEIHSWMSSLLGDLVSYNRSHFRLSRNRTVGASGNQEFTVESKFFNLLSDFVLVQCIH